MFRNLKKHIIASFKPAELEFFNKIIPDFKKNTGIIVYPGLEIITNESKNALITATEAIPFRYGKDTQVFFPKKQIAIAYKDIDEKGNFPEFVELSKNDFRDLFFGYKL